MPVQEKLSISIGSSLPTITTNTQSLDKFASAIIDALYQGDEERLKKVFFQLSIPDQNILSTLTACWHNDSGENIKPFNDLILLCENSQLVLPHLILAEKALEIDDIKLHEDFVFKAFSLLGKRGVDVEKRLISFHQIVKLKGLIHSSNFEKAIALLETLIIDSDKFIEGYCYYLFGIIYKLKGKRYHLNAKNSFESAVNVFEVHLPNRYMLNLARLQLSLLLELSASEVSEIANEFTKLGCPREASLALAQYNYLTKFSKNGVVVQDRQGNCERVGNYYFISESMKEALKRLSVIASGDGHVLIFGEEGTGKEVFAETIYQLSERRHKPFTSVNCSQIKNEFFEAEFFGYERGAFTGADKPKPGLLEEYNGGMIFLDEIAELSREIQAKLLTVLQQGVFRRMGSNKEISVDIRFIGATNREIKKMIERDKINRESTDPLVKDTFRSDLANRFPWRITVPPLNKRREEIVFLAEKFLVELTKEKQFILDTTAKAYLSTREYPSNIRSLKDFLRCAIAYATQQNTILITDQTLLQTEVFMEMDKTTEDEINNLPFDEQVAYFASRLLLKTLAKCGNNAKLAAQKLAMPVRTFYKRLETYNLRLPKA
jgi:DNA-binding NtrC family response regulator